jgi:hypothetical protein
VEDQRGAGPAVQHTGPAGRCVGPTGRRNDEQGPWGGGAQG